MIKITNTKTNENLTNTDGKLGGDFIPLIRASVYAEKEPTILHPDWQFGSLDLKANGTLAEKVALMKIALDMDDPWRSHLVTEYTDEDLVEFQTGQRPSKASGTGKKVPVRKKLDVAPKSPL